MYDAWIFTAKETYGLESPEDWTRFADSYIDAPTHAGGKIGDVAEEIIKKSIFLAEKSEHARLLKRLADADKMEPPKRTRTRRRARIKK
ncbi:MAG: hypothetical protein ACR2QC_03585 [Gammaproteobacteria bacterium]